MTTIDATQEVRFVVYADRTFVKGNLKGIKLKSYQVASFTTLKEAYRFAQRLVVPLRRLNYVDSNVDVKIVQP